MSLDPSTIHIESDICQICLQKLTDDKENSHDLTICLGCGVMLHSSCCPLKTDTYTCAKCGWRSDPNTTTCVACNKSGGFMMSVPTSAKKLFLASPNATRYFIHDICAQALQEMTINHDHTLANIVSRLPGKSISGIDSLLKRRTHKCIYCSSESEFNFPVNCLYPGCDSWFHVTCALMHEGTPIHPYKCHAHKSCVMITPRLDHTSDDSFLQKLGIKDHPSVSKKTDVIDAKVHHSYMARMYPQELVPISAKKSKRGTPGIDFDLITELFNGYISLQECALYSQIDSSSTKVHDDRNEEIIPAKIECKIRHCYKRVFNTLRFGSLTYRDLISILFKNSLELAGFFNPDDPNLFYCDDSTIFSRIGFKSWFGSRRGTTEPPPTFILLSLGFVKSNLPKLPLVWSLLENVEGVDDATIMIFRVCLSCPGNKDSSNISVPTLQTMLLPADFSNLNRIYSIHPLLSTSTRGPRFSSINTKLKSTLTPSSSESIGSFFLSDPIQIDTFSPFGVTEAQYNTDVVLIPMQAWHSVFDGYETIEFAKTLIMYREEMIDQFITLMNCSNLENLPIMENTIEGDKFVAPPAPVAWKFNTSDTVIILKPLSMLDVDWAHLKVPTGWVRHNNRSFEIAEDDAQSDYPNIAKFYNLSEKDLSEMNIEATRLFLRNVGRHFIVPVTVESSSNRAGMLRLLTVQQIEELATNQEVMY